MFARPRRTFSSTPKGLQMGTFGFWQKVAWSQEKTRLSSMVESGKWELTIQQMQQQLAYLQAITIVSGFIRLNSTWNFPFVRSISNGFVMDTVTITLSFNVIQFPDLEKPGNEKYNCRWLICRRYGKASLRERIPFFLAKVVLTSRGTRARLGWTFSELRFCSPWLRFGAIVCWNTGKV